GFVRQLRKVAADVDRGSKGREGDPRGVGALVVPDDDIDQILCRRLQVVDFAARVAHRAREVEHQGDLEAFALAVVAAGAHGARRAWTKGGRGGGYDPDAGIEVALANGRCARFRIPGFEGIQNAEKRRPDPGRGRDLELGVERVGREFERAL